ncbi:Low-density lipoprotein receptor-related protein 6, partial [Geodia barretti]
HSAVSLPPTLQKQDHEYLITVVSFRHSHLLRSLFAVDLPLGQDASETAARGLQCTRTPWAEITRTLTMSPRFLLAIISLLAVSTAQDAVYLPYLDLSDTGVESIQLPQLDDGISEQIVIPDGIPFGNSHPLAVWIANNGIFSFNEEYAHWSPELFPGTSSSVVNGYLVTPFWDDVDISRPDGGSIYYQVHDAAGNNSGSIALLGQVNDFIQASVENSSFSGVWMLVAMWDQVLPYFGFSDDDDVDEMNSFQAIIVTDHTNQTYAVFTYKCGDLNWARTPTIGFNAASLFYENYELSGSPNAESMDCTNGPGSEYFNLMYNITAGDFIPPPPLPTSEPPQASYLEWVEETGVVNAGQIEACDDCSSEEIPLPNPFPFGNYYHNSVYMSTNGIISFGVEFPHFSPSYFPTVSASTYFDYAVAPYWADHDARLHGTVSWEQYSTEESTETDDIIARVNEFINTNTEETNFAGNFVFVGNWREMHPYPAGASQLQAAPFLDMNNTYQAVLVTDGDTKSYAIFTYKCGSLGWSEEAIVGYNAAGDYYMNHPLSGLYLTQSIACVHTDSVWNNVIYDLVPNPALLTTDPTPEPLLTIGTCTAAGFESCCAVGVGQPCLGNPQDCYCDVDCFLFGDCCSDIDDICTFDLPEGDYLLFASHSTINHVNLNGENFNIFISQLSGGAYGINFHHSAGYMYWTDYIEDVVYRANLTTGEDRVAIVTEHLPEPEDLAVDWVSNKLYWIDALWARIEVMDIATERRAELIRTSNHSIPRGLAIDPIAHYMFWTDWGTPSLIERSSMDGKGRIVLFSNDILQPLGIACDYSSQRIYWSDAGLSTISYAFYNGTGRSVLVGAQQRVAIPFDLTLYEDLLYWTDWFNNTVYGTHKIHGTDPLGNFTDIIVIYEGLPVNPNGIEAVSPLRQPEGDNLCVANNCEHICLLSSVEAQGWSCVCETGYILNEDQTTCSVDPNPTVEPTNNGSCQASGYTDCCEVGYCGGYPGNCFCDINCHGRGDCCNDTSSTCPEVPGSCVEAGYDTCCTDGFCAGFPESANCYCDDVCLAFGDCCDDFEDICPGGTPTTPPDSFGSCVEAGYTECCADQDGDCAGSDPFDCYCDVFCYYLDDCCTDIDDICEQPVIDGTEYLLFANHFFINRANYDGSGLSVLLTLPTGGAVGVQFHYAQNKMYYSDFVENRIYSASLDTGGDVEVLLDDNVEVPEDLAVDWVANNLYWTDSFWARIEVMDLDTTERAELVRTGNHSIPRAIVVDPMTRYMYWTDWGEVAKIEKAGMDGLGRTVIIDTELIWPNGLALDYDTQILYWADANLDKIEYASVDGSGRTLLETGETGLLHPYALTIHGDLLYWTDWQNNSVFATHKINGVGVGGDIASIVSYLVVNPNGIEAVGPNKQPSAENPCEENNCTHLCLLSVTDPRGYSCACPLGYELDGTGLDCFMSPTSTPLPEFGSCVSAGYTVCCVTGYCAGYPANCFCDRDCHARGDCCFDTPDLCEDYDSYLIFANHFFINRCNLDGSSLVTLLIRQSGGAAGIEYDLAPGQEKLFYTDYVTNQILMAHLNGTESTPIMEDDLEVPEGLAYDWIGHNLYWTDSFWARIEVMDLNTTERGEVLRVGANTVPRGIAVDPINRVLYWTDWGQVAKIEKASMDGQNRVELINTDLVGPYGLTIDYAEQKIYWTDGVLDKIEYCNTDGSGRITLISSPGGLGFGVPYSLTLEGDYLYWSEWDQNSLFSIHKTEGGNVTQILSGLVVNPNGIQTVSAGRRIFGENPCASNDCTHLCLLSSVSSTGYSCTCPLGTRLDSDGISCVDDPTSIPEFGSCNHYQDCCEAGYCAGYPPNCFCDHDCHSRGDCCADVGRICPEFEGSCRDANYTDCCTAGLCIGEPDVTNCYCDITCLDYGDCCSDFFEICSDARSNIAIVKSVFVVSRRCYPNSDSHCPDLYYHFYVIFYVNFNAIFFYHYHQYL